MSDKTPKPVPLKVLQRMAAIQAGFTQTGECWEWPKSRNVQTGYGQMGYYEDGKHCVFTSHRVSLTLARGAPDLPTASALHTCDNRGCFNPEHLYWGTQADNIADMFSRGRQQDYNREHQSGEKHWTYLRGSDSLLRGEQCHSAKLTEDAVRYIRASSERPIDLARMFSVNYGAVWAIKSGRTWKHVT